MKEYRYILTYKGETMTIKDNPSEEHKLGISYYRHEVYHGILRKFTMQLRFALTDSGGGNFILNAYDSEDIKAQVEIEIKKYYGQTNGYNTIFSGYISMNPDDLKINKIDVFLECRCVDGMMEQKFAARDEIEYDINKLISTDGVTMQAFSSSPKSITFKGIDIIRLADFNGDFIDDILITDNDQDPKIAFYLATDVLSNGIGSGLKVETRDAKMYENETGVNVKLTISEVTYTGNTMYFQCTRKSMLPLYPARFAALVYGEIKIYDANDILKDFNFWYALEIDTKYVYFPEFQVPFDSLQDALKNMLGVYYLEPGWYMVLRVIIVPNSNLWQYCDAQLGGNLKVRFKIGERSIAIGDSQVLCYPGHEAFTRLLQLMTSKESNIYSRHFGHFASEIRNYSYLGDAKDDMITTGWNLRHVPDKPFMLKFRDLFKTFDGIYCLMVGFDRRFQRFYIEKREKAYDSSFYVGDLGEVSELTIIPLKKAYYNQITAGYDFNGEYEKFQGSNETNLLSEYSTDMPVKDDVDMKCKYRTDSVGVELSRRKPYYDYPNEDTKQDNKIFIVRTKDGETIQGGDDLSGFPGVEQRYNIVFLSRENVIRHSGFLKTQFWKEEDFTIKFQSSTKEVNITYRNQNGEIVEETSDIRASELLTDRYFNPQMYEVKANFSDEFLANMDKNPHGIVRFAYEGTAYEGFIDELVLEEDNLGTCKLFAKDTDTDVQKIFMDKSDALFMDGYKHKLL